MLDKIIISKIKLRDEEKIIRIYLRSLWFWWRQIMVSAVLLILPFFLLFPLLQKDQVGLAAGSIIFLAGFVVLVKIYLDYRLNIFILTNKRVIDMVHHCFFNFSLSSVLYAKIQDVSCDSRGLRGFLWRLGDVYVTLAEATFKLQLPTIRHPEKIMNEIIYYQELFTSGQSGQDDRAWRLLYKIKEKVGAEEFQKLIAD